MSFRHAFKIREFEVAFWKLFLMHCFVFDLHCADPKPAQCIDRCVAASGSRLSFWRGRRVLLVAAGRAFIVAALGAAVTALFAAGTAVFGGLHFLVGVLGERGKGGKSQGDHCEMDCRFHTVPFCCVFVLFLVARTGVFANSGVSPPQCLWSGMFLLGIGE